MATQPDWYSQSADPADALTDEEFVAQSSAEMFGDAPGADDIEPDIEELHHHKVETPKGWNPPTHDEVVRLTDEAYEKAGRGELGEAGLHAEVERIQALSVPPAPERVDLTAGKSREQIVSELDEIYGDESLSEMQRHDRLVAVGAVDPNAGWN